MTESVLDALIRELSDLQGRGGNVTSGLITLMADYIKSNNDLMIKVLKHLRGEETMPDAEISHLIEELEASSKELMSNR